MLKKVGVSLLAVAFIAIAISPYLSARPVWKPQAFEVTYAGRMTLDANSAEGARIWVPLASDRAGQRIIDRRINIQHPYTITKDPVYGNEIVYLEFSEDIPEKIEFSIDYMTEVSPHHFFENNKEEDTTKYLKPSRLMIVDEEVNKRASGATSELTSLVSKARAIYDYVIQNVAYDKKTPGWGQGDTARVCLLGKGNCTDFHSLFISMSHAASIPARFKIGLPIPDENEGKIKGYHCWAEFYDAKKGWQPVDVSESWKHPELKDAYFADFSTNKFLISVGRDVVLEPKQDDKPVNIFFYPYMEVNGQAKDPNFKSEFQFRKLKD